MITKVEGFILSEVEYGETSKVINVLTKEYGLLGIMCKGVKSLKSKLRALTMRFTYGFFYIYKKDNKLSILKDVDIIDPLKNIHQDITLISYVNYITELTHQVLKECNDQKIYDLLIETIKKIEQKLDPMVLTNILELKYLDYLGVGLNLNGCVHCGNTNDIITIDGDIGGYLCKNCLTNEKVVSLKAVKMLRMYYYVDIQNIQKLDISSEVTNDINQFLTKYYDRYTGLYLKSKNFLEKLKNL